jgi:hypothetical protein
MEKQVKVISYVRKASKFRNTFSYDSYQGKGLRDLLNWKPKYWPILQYLLNELQSRNWSGEVMLSNL